MLFIRNAFYFRKFFKEQIARESSSIDLNFVGSLHPEKRRNETGFSKLIYGNRIDLGHFLKTIALNVAADDQAIYELIQNADDCESTFFSVNYNEKYLLCINNGNYFTDYDMSAIINVAGNYKDGEDIGSWGIGFKILHRLLGTDDGEEAIINDYAGPVIFSWNKYIQLKKFLDRESIYVSGVGKNRNSYNYERDKENPWLVKILYTCFPSHYKEQIRLGDYDTRETKFGENELSEMQEFLQESLRNFNLTEDNFLKNGSMFFLKLGKGKSRFLDEGIDRIKSGLSYSFKFLNSLQKIYINGEIIKAKTILNYSHSFPIGSKEFIEINPNNKKRDIKFSFAFYYDYKEASELQNGLAPNLYTYFSMDEEKNGFSFLLHCNAFDINSDRRKLQATSQINEKLLPIIAQNLIKYTDTQKETNRDLFLSLYANFLLSKYPTNKPHINNNFCCFIHQYVTENIPTKNGYSDNPKNVKINKLEIDIDLNEFGLDHIQWFAWNTEADDLLIEKAVEKLGVEEWDIRDIIENINPK